MGDVGDVFREMRKDSQKKRESNRELSTKLLREKNIPFIAKNKGYHLIVEGKDCYIDFWPSTGKWIDRKGEKGFGVRNLIKHILS